MSAVPRRATAPAAVGHAIAVRVSVPVAQIIVAGERTAVIVCRELHAPPHPEAAEQATVHAVASMAVPEDKRRRVIELDAHRERERARAACPVTAAIMSATAIPRAGA